MTDPLYHPPRLLFICIIQLFKILCNLPLFILSYFFYSIPFPSGVTGQLHLHLRYLFPQTLPESLFHSKFVFGLFTDSLDGSCIDPLFTGSVSYVDFVSERCTCTDTWPPCRSFSPTALTSLGPSVSTLYSSPLGPRPTTFRNVSERSLNRKSESLYLLWRIKTRPLSRLHWRQKCPSENDDITLIWSVNILTFVSPVNSPITD